jgi:hypothetical protein
MLRRKAQDIGTLYNAKPTENDANAAASRHLSRRYDDARSALNASDFRELARYPSGPEPIESLVPRLVAFGLLIRTDLEADAAGRDEDAADVFERYGKGGTGQLWTALTAVMDS